MAQESFYWHMGPGANAAGTVWALSAPGSANGGGLTVTDINIINSIANTITYTFKKYSVAGGTATLNGTVATTGGTLAAGVALAATMGPNNFLASGEVLQIAWTGAGTPAVDARILGHYVEGRGSV